MFFATVFVNLLQVAHLLARISVFIAHIREEKHANVFVIVFKALENQQGWDYEEDLSVALFELLSELLVLLCGGLDDLTEMQKLVALLAV